MPLLSAGLLAFLLFQMIMHADLLVGNGGAGTYILAVSVLVVGLLAAAYASHVRRRNPGRYQKLTDVIETA